MSEGSEGGNDAGPGGAAPHGLVDELRPFRWLIAGVVGGLVFLFAMVPHWSDEARKAARLEQREMDRQRRAAMPVVAPPEPPAPQLPRVSAKLPADAPAMVEGWKEDGPGKRSGFVLLPAGEVDVRLVVRFLLGRAGDTGAGYTSEGCEARLTVDGVPLNTSAYWGQPERGRTERVEVREPGYVPVSLAYGSAGGACEPAVSVGGKPAPVVHNAAGGG
jgi:hypothetical protein